MTDRIEVTDYDSPDVSGTKPNSGVIYDIWVNNKTKGRYSVSGIGFNTVSQLWEYQYERVTDFPAITFHRPVKEFYEKFTRAETLDLL